ncbi:hypothetical protein RhiirA4_479785 [Rhizophagus irregularis]|uniref:Endonuclease/exonuclease/phosphatase domain-containing protein n=1 Tax=Rhizophagus irregularis TaxID=588596 RepID=A0A2I1HGX3_9GLOM|nr:hypothetical protein RhiirA4_479785 [Rhizophagus irregularis]
MDWHQINEQITIIFEEITHLTEEFAQLQHRVKWLEEHHPSRLAPTPSVPPPSCPPVTEPVDQGWDTTDTSGSRRLNLIAKLCSNNYHVVILGDFNIDEVAQSNYSHNHFRLLRLLSSRYFNDHQAHSFSSNDPDPTFFHANSSSRLDYIWSSPGFPAPGLFTQVVTCPPLLDRPFTDYRDLITIFDFSSCMAILAKSRLKQKKEYHRLWHALKAAILGSAVRILPHQHVSNTHRHSYSLELTKLITVNKFLDRFLYRLSTHCPSRPIQISQMMAALPSHLEILASLLPDYSVPVYPTSPLTVFKSFLRTQKNLISAFLSTKFAQHLMDSVEYYTALRDEHFSDSLGKFIDSALSVEK